LRVPEVTSCAPALVAAGASQQAGGVTIDRNKLLDLIRPLSLAAYAAWGAVWMTVDGPGAGIAMGLYLAAFIGVHLIGQPPQRRAFAVLATAMAAAALVVIALQPTTAAPILLVLLAGVLGSELPPRPLVAALVAVNLVAGGLLVTLNPAPLRWGLVTLAAYASFQAFAALVMATARRAEAMATELRAVNAELLATRSLLAEGARDQERLRLSRDLHDVAGHTLTALKLNLAALARDAGPPDPSRVALCAQLADELLQTLRGVVRQVRRDAGIDLAEAIAGLGAAFPRPLLHAEIGADVRIDSLEHAEALLRTVQEALTNAARHSGAANLWAVLQRDGDRLRLELRDDGTGSARLQPGNGLLGMRERLLSAGGGLEIEAGAGRGLRLHAWLPAA
jgi:signal transduction histidine kinase